MKPPALYRILALCAMLRRAGCSFLLSLGLIEKATAEEIALRRLATAEAEKLRLDLARTRALVLGATSTRSPGGVAITVSERRAIARAFAAEEREAQNLEQLIALPPT